MGKEDLIFLRLYSDNAEFHDRLHRDTVDETYSTLVQPRQDQALAGGSSMESVPNYEVTATAEEAPLLERLMAAEGIDVVRFVHENGDVTFSFAESVRDTVENLLAKLRAELTKAVSATYASAPKKPGRSRPELNYRTLAKLFPEVVSGEYRYLELEAGEAMMPLHLEWIGADELSVSHTYVQNGDLMYDPEMTFRVDRDKGTLEPLTFRQDGSIPIYQEVYPEPGRWIPKLSRDLSTFAQQWLKNISQQGYRKREAVWVRDGEDTRVTFQENGAAVNPPPPKVTGTGMAPAQEQTEAASPSHTRDPVVPAYQAGDTPTPLEPEGAPDPTGAGEPEQPENDNDIPFEPDFAPNAEKYWDLKAQHPDKLVGVQVGEFMMFYGKDAEEAAAALGTKTPVLDLPGLGQTPATGSREAWQAVLKKLLEHGHSVVLARPDPEHGPDAPYEIIRESTAADYIPIGMELMLDGRRMKIDSVDFASGEVKLLDLDLRGWFPVFRSAPVSYVRESVEDVLTSEEYIAAEMAHQLRQEEAEQAAAGDADAPAQLSAPEPEQVEIDGGKVAAPSAPVTTKVVGRVDTGAYEVIIQKMGFGPEKHNFHITDDNLGAGGEKTKYQYNVVAICTLKQIEGEGRLATPEEQEVLSRYVGWGGIAKAFDPDDPKWAKEYVELKELLTPEEYNSARSTVLNAHYTSPTVIKAMYQAVENMGYQPGTVLEPSMGVGNFFGLLPESLNGAKLYGVELDSLTGRMARQLYQNADITVAGFETTSQRDFYDLAVGNVPFGQYHVNDPAYNKLGFNIHNYFFAKTLDQVRPGGIIAFVTSRYTMDSKDATVRKYLAERADLLVKNGHSHFDNWAADFGEKVTAMELKPEGTGFRSKTRFAKFYNLPELMSIWKESADIQTADMLKLPVPEAVHVTVTTEPSSFQQKMVAELGERAEKVRDGSVDPSEDNMLKITSDGRKLALDQRLEILPPADGRDTAVHRGAGEGSAHRAGPSCQR